MEGVNTRGHDVSFEVKYTIIKMKNNLCQLVCVTSVVEKIFIFKGSLGGHKLQRIIAFIKP